MAAGLGYVESRALPRHLFPKILHHAMMKITPSVVAAAFSATGIYPFNSFAVKPILPPISCSTSDAEKEKDSTCSDKSSYYQCKSGSTSHQVNMLVKVGMVPESLAEIFIEPPPIKQSKRKNCQEARLIESDRPANKTDCYTN